MRINGSHKVKISWDVGWEDLYDSSVLSLIVSNMVVLIWALLARWPVGVVMWVYWAQSVVIGIFWFFRILTYTNLFNVFDLTWIGRLGSGIFFLCYYMGFHLVYAGFFLSGTFFERPKGPLLIEAIVIFACLFSVEQFNSFRKEMRVDRQKQVDIKAFKTFPYLRIIPMHLTIFIGGALSDFGLGGQYTLLVFLLLKTAADVIMSIQQKKGFVISNIDTKGGLLDFMRTANPDEIVLPGGRTILRADDPELFKKLKAVEELPEDVRIKVYNKLLSQGGQPEIVKNDLQSSPAQVKTECRCNEVDFLSGPEAQEYAESHLVFVSAVQGGAKFVYECPRTRKRWIKVLDSLLAEPKDDRDVICRCREVENLEGEQAYRYAKIHLKVLRSDGGWETTYECPYTGRRYIMDFTQMADSDIERFARLRVLREKQP